MKIDQTVLWRGIGSALIGLGILAAGVHLLSGSKLSELQILFGIVLPGIIMVLVGGVELLRIMKMLTEDEPSETAAEKAERLVFKALYFEFAPFFKSGNEVLVPQATIPGDLGRRVSDILANLSES